MRSGRSFGMILYAEDWQLLVTHSFDCAVVQVGVGHFNFGGKRLRIDSESVILRRDRHFACAQVFYRLIRAAMAKFQFECRSTKSEAENLMTKTNPEDWFLAYQIVHSFVCIIERRGITRTVGKKNSVRIESQYFLSGGGSGHHSHFETFLSKQAQNVLLNPVVVCSDSKADRWQGPCTSSVCRFLDGPWRAEFVLRIPAINLP